jgi:hypothetical protein
MWCLLFLFLIVLISKPAIEGFGRGRGLGRGYNGYGQYNGHGGFGYGGYSVSLVDDVDNQNPFFMERPI